MTEMDLENWPTVTHTAPVVPVLGNGLQQESPVPLRLNLGAGPLPLPEADGWRNLDRKTGQEAYPLPYPDESIEEIRASHLLEHFAYAEIGAVVAEWVRVLKPGGWLRIAVPDFEWICRTYLEQSDTPYPIQGYVMGGQTDRDDFHRTIFDRDGLAELLEAVGLVEISEWESELRDCASLPVSLNLAGRKPREGEERAPELEPVPIQQGELLPIPRNAITAVMSMPRLGFSDNMFTALRAFTRWGITFERSSGVFWDQGMYDLFTRNLGVDRQYLLTVDYDTVFTPEDVQALYSVMERRPEIDALCAVQIGRQREAPLYRIGRYEVEAGQAAVPAWELAAETMPVATGHFGLTLFRLERLRTLPHPWFVGVPDAAGGWGEGHTDPDIAFWAQWERAGYSLHVANRVVVGHLQLMVSWPDRRQRALHQYSDVYQAQGKPAGVWR